MEEQELSIPGNQGHVECPKQNNSNISSEVLNEITDVHNDYESIYVVQENESAVSTITEFGRKSDCLPITGHSNNVNEFDLEVDCSNCFVKDEVNDSGVDESDECGVDISTHKEGCADSSPTTGSLSEGTDGFVLTIIDIKSVCESDILASNEITVSETLVNNVGIPQFSVTHIQNNCSGDVSCETEKVEEDTGAADPHDPVYILDDSKNESVNSVLMSAVVEFVPDCSVSEICLKNKTSIGEDENQDVICLEHSSTVPLPIPIKLETNLDREIALTNSSKNVEIIDGNMPRNAGISSVIKDRSPPVKEIIFSAVAYACHLCKTTFQEHELLNEHMMLHRKNMVESKTQKNRIVCQQCNKQLSSWQSLQLHVKHHESVLKPHMCRECKKSFRHYDNYKLHIQKHKKEKRRVLEQEKFNTEVSARDFNFGKLVGPLFVKESLLSKKSEEQAKLAPSKSVYFTRDNMPAKLPFDVPPIFVCKDKTKENLKRNRPGEDSDDVIPLQTFSNVENIVMNAARFIVKVDNIDPILLKKRIMTPDISIVKSSSTNRRLGEKRKIVLPLSDRVKRLKLDQIENIIIESYSDYDLNQFINNEYCNQDFDYDEEEDEYLEDHGDVTTSKTNNNVDHETMTNDELFALLNDDRDSTMKNSPVWDCESEIRKNRLVNFMREATNSQHQKSGNIRCRDTNSASPRSPNVIMLKQTPLSREIPVSALTGSKSLVSEISVACVPGRKDKNTCSPRTETSNNKADNDEYDAFDKIFYRVALRRLLMIHRRAAENNGKVSSRYQIGPLFWVKALRRARAKPINFETSTLLNSISTVSSNEYKYLKVDERQTNDLKTLQIRAENKLRHILDRVKVLENFNDLNLTGPLFWKNTLRLASVHCPSDLKMLLKDEQLWFNNIEFVGDKELIKEENKKLHITDDSKRNVSSKCVPSKTKVIDLYSPLEQKIHSTKSVSLNFSERMDKNKETCLAKRIPNEIREMRRACPENGINITEPSDILVSSKFEGTVKTRSSILYKSCIKPLIQSETSLQLRHNLDTSELGTSVSEMKGENNSKLNVDNAMMTSDEKISLQINGDEILTHPNKLVNYVHSTAHSSPENVNLGINHRAVLPDKVSGDYQISSSVIESSIPEINTIGFECQAIPLESYIDAAVPLKNANILLNVRGNLQLIATNDEKSAMLQGDSNYVLISDKMETMQLIKESDIQLIEGGISTAAQFVVNAHGESFSNFEVGGDADDGQFTYALQLDDKNYTAVSK